MRGAIVAVLLACAVALSGQDRGRPTETTACTPSMTAHPRIALNSCTRADVLASVNPGGLYHARFQAMVDELDANWPTLEADCNRGTCPRYALNTALVYQLFDDLKGVNRRGHSKVDFAAKSKAIIEHYRTAIGSIGNYDFWPLPIAYDFLHPYLTDSERRAIVTWWKGIDDLGAICGDPPLASQSLNNSQVAVCWSAQVMMGLAAKNDGYETAWVDEQYGWYDEKFRDATGVTNWESTYSEATGGDPSQGISYVGYTAPTIMPLEEAWRTAHGISKSAHYGPASANFIRGYPRMVLALLLPWREGGNSAVLFSSFRAMPRYLATGEGQGVTLPLHYVQNALQGVDDTMAGLARWLQVNRVGDVNSSGASALRYTGEYILFGPRTRPPIVAPTAGLPTAWRAGTARYVFVENFVDSDAGWVTIEAHQWPNPDGERPRNPGGVVLARNGFGTFYAGDESNSYSTNGWCGAGNGTIFPDRSVTGPRSSQDSMGCQRRMTVRNFYSSEQLTKGSGVDLLAAVRDSLASGPVRLSYVGQNLVRAFDSTTTSDRPTNPDRIAEYWKDIGVSMQDDRVVVVEYDRTVTTAPDYVPTNLVQFPVDPSIDGIRTANVPVRNPTPCPTWFPEFQCDTGNTGLGHSTFAGATLITATQTANGASGKLWVTPLMPSGLTVIKVGGPDDQGNSFDKVGAFSLEGTDPYGVRRPVAGLTGPAVQRNYASQYRVEMTAATRGTATRFLTVKELTASNGRQSQTKLWSHGPSADGFACARVGSVAFCFGEDGVDKTSGDAVFEDAGTFTMKWCGLMPSTARTLTRGANIASMTRLEDGGVGPTYMTDRGGCVNLSVVVAADGTTASNLVTVR